VACALSGSAHLYSAWVEPRDADVLVLEATTPTRTPRPCAISLIERPLRRCSATASRRNSGEYRFWKLDPWQRLIILLARSDRVDSPALGSAEDGLLDIEPTAPGVKAADVPPRCGPWKTEGCPDRSRCSTADRCGAAVEARVDRSLRRDDEGLTANQTRSGRAAYLFGR
jgi:hypothetical protein